MWIRLCGISLLGVLASCSSPWRLRPEPSGVHGVVLSRDGRAATLETQEVRFTANGDAWNREPRDLPRYATPVRVTLENYSGHALRIQYADFELQGEARYAVLPPHLLSRSAPAPVSEADPSTPPLLTGYALRLSVKEGVLKDGGRMSGFLYFQNLGAHERRVTLQARLVDASTGETFTTLRIPFQVLGSSR